jgi:hypothetical protein
MIWTLDGQIVIRSCYLGRFLKIDQPGSFHHDNRVDNANIIIIPGSTESPGTTRKQQMDFADSLGWDSGVYDVFRDMGIPMASVNTREILFRRRLKVMKINLALMLFDDSVITLCFHLMRVLLTSTNLATPVGLSVTNCIWCDLMMPCW